jgi:hypothetical protein
MITKPPLNYQTIESDGCFVTSFVAFLKHIALGATTDPAGNAVLLLGATSTPEGKDFTAPFQFNVGTGQVVINGSTLLVP